MRGRLAPRLADLSRGALDAVGLTRACPGCGVPLGADWLCAPCRDVVLTLRDHRGCPRCALPVGPSGWADAQGCSECRDRRLGFHAAVALGPYAGTLRALCLRMKSEKSRWVARRVGGLLLQTRAEALRAAGADLVVPIPLFWWSRWCRGYNQAEALAATLAAGLGIEYARALRRVRPTRKLARLSRTARAEELRGSMAVPRRAAGRLVGRTVLLVDDILTSGATCGEAARVLRRAGARRVVVAVVGRTESRV